MYFPVFSFRILTAIEIICRYLQPEKKFDNQMAKKKKKQQGHYCRICGDYKANEKFSGKGHAQHICKSCMSAMRSGKNPEDILPEPLPVNRETTRFKKLDKEGKSVLKGYRLLPVPENPKLRDSLADKSLAELTRLLSTYRKLHNSTDVDTVKRAIRAIEIEEYYKHQSAEYREFPQIHSLIIGVDIARELRREKISHRLKQRLDEGMVNEVKALLDSGISSEDLIYYGLEYKYLTLYVLGKLSFNEMFHQLEIAIHQFAKRQMTWFRGMERRGFTIHWLDACLPMEDKVEKIINLLHTKN